MSHSKVNACLLEVKPPGRDTGETGQDAQDLPRETLHCVQMPDLCGQEGGCRAGWGTSAHHFHWLGEGFPAVKWGSWVSV